ncbi:MAG: PEP-CTERM sorting domain-containing protein [Planctomycetota bacterium]
MNFLGRNWVGVTMIGFAGIGLSGLAGNAGAVIIAPAETTVVFSPNGNGNVTTNPTSNLLVGDAGTSGNAGTTVISFDLSQNTTEIQNATEIFLELEIELLPGGAFPFEVTLYGDDDPSNTTYETSDLDVNSATIIDTYAADTSFTSVGQTLQIDVTSYVQNELSGNTQIASFAFVVTDDSYSVPDGTINSVRFASTADASPPQLNVVPEPASLALIGLGGAAVAMRRRF